VLVIVGVDQLYTDSHTIADSADASFKKGRHAEHLSDFAGVTHAVAAIGHDRHARDDFQITNLREIRQDIVLYTVGEIGVLLFIAQILKRQDGDGFVDFAR